MFITVRYGNGLEALFNPNCKTAVLLDDIKRRCDCDRGVNIDLSDESGNIKYLTDHLSSYATEFVKERESFILIKVDRRPETDTPMYTPLLNDVFLVTASFLDRLAKNEGDAASIKTSSSKGTPMFNKKISSALSKARNIGSISPPRQPDKKTPRGNRTISKSKK